MVVDRFFLKIFESLKESTLGGNLEVEALANYASVEKTQTVFTTETLRTAVGAWCKDKEIDI